jgi:hypothetical protein
MLCAKIPEYSTYSLKEFTEVHFCIANRMTKIIIEGLETQAIIPMIDFLNPPKDIE